MSRAARVYLGWDGSYVMSFLPLVAKPLGSGGHYLSYNSKKRYQAFDCDELEPVFKRLKLKMLEVVQLDIRVHRPRKRVRKPSK